MTTIQSLRGVYIGREFNASFRDLSLSGVFVGCDFTEADLSRAELSGEFTSCTFNATWRAAERTGSFVDCQEE